MLRGIKERAEGRTLVPGGWLLAARAGWLLAGLGVLGLVLAHRRWWPWLALPLALLAPAVLATGDREAALAGFLAIGITLSGALAWGRRWWSAFLLIATAVLLVLLLAPDAYAAFGLVFDLAALLVLGVVLFRLGGPQLQVNATRSGAHA